MMSPKKLTFSLVGIFFLLMLSTASYAQGCKGFTKNKCLPNLSPYVNNGQINSTTLFEGDSATVRMTFYSLLDYRLLVCSHPILGENVRFRITDTEGEEVYNSKGTKENSFDFRVNSTQELIINVVVPEDPSSANSIPPSGCVSVVLGFRE